MLATIGVIAVCLYGAVRCFQFTRILAGFGLLAVVPVWFAFQLVVLVVFDELRSRGIASREYHLDYAVTPVLNVVVAGLIGYAVLRFVSKFAASRSLDEEQVDAIESNWSGLLEPRKIAGAIFVAAGAATMSFFILSGVLLVIVGVSLIMDVRLWRR